jgi:putative tricarboxylic transport membrane protein
MQEIQSLLGGFAVALSWFNLMLMLAGIVLGVIIGVLPGLGGANGVAILLPLTFSMAQQPGGATSAIILLSCIYWGALFGGAITSILFNIPGEPWSVATTFDGYPLGQKGRAGAALTAAFTSSFVGALVAVLLITFLSPIVAKFALRFGPPEFFSVYLLTFCAFVGMSKGSPFKTISSMMLGFALAAIGMDTVTGQLRMTFGFEVLIKGFDFLIAVIGLFGIGEILLTLEEGLEFKGTQAKLNMRVVIDTWKELPRYWKTSIRSATVGCMMGIVPGGATPASFMSYGLARRCRAMAPSSAPAWSKVWSRRKRRRMRPGTSAAAADAHPRRAGLAHGGGAAGRPHDLGTAARTAPLHREAGLRLGPHRVDVPGQHRGPHRRAHVRAVLRGDPARALFHHRAGDPRDLRDRRLHRPQLDVRRVAHGAVRRHGLRSSRSSITPWRPWCCALVLGDRAEDSFRQSMLMSQGDMRIFYANALVGSITTLSLLLLFWPLISMGIDLLRGRRAPTIDKE